MTVSACTTGSGDATTNLAVITAQFRLFPGTPPMLQPPADNLTTTTVISAVSPAEGPAGNTLYFVEQGIKGARFLSIVMASVLTVFVLATAPDMSGVLWFVAAMTGLLLGLGIWVSFSSHRQSLPYARTIRRLTIYFATTGSLLTVLTIASHMLVWWKMTSQSLL